MRVFLFLAAIVGLLSGACFADAGGNEQDCELGSEGCACTEEGQCVPPLECRSDLCVAPDDSGTTTSDGSTPSGSSGTTSGSSGTSSGTSGTSSGTSGTSSGTSGNTAATSATTGATTTTSATSSATSATSSATDTPSGGTTETTSDPGTSSSSSEAACGNGLLEPEEECDPNAPAPYGEDACDTTDCTLLYFDCNPLRDQCFAGWKCRDDGLNLSCAQSDDTTGVGQPCTTTRECVQGSICTGGDIDCNPPGGACCVAWCDTQEDPDPCGNQLSCMSWWTFLMQPPPNPGLDHLGICRP